MATTLITSIVKHFYGDEINSQIDAIDAHVQGDANIDCSRIKSIARDVFNKNDWASRALGSFAEKAIRSTLKDRITAYNAENINELFQVTKNERDLNKSSQNPKDIETLTQKIHEQRPTFSNEEIKHILIHCKAKNVPQPLTMGLSDEGKLKTYCSFRRAARRSVVQDAISDNNTVNKMIATAKLIEKHTVELDELRKFNLLYQRNGKFTDNAIKIASEIYKLHQEIYTLSSQLIQPEIWQANLAKENPFPRFGFINGTLSQIKIHAPNQSGKDGVGTVLVIDVFPDINKTEGDKVDIRHQFLLVGTSVYGHQLAFAPKP